MTFGYDPIVLYIFRAMALEADFSPRMGGILSGLAHCCGGTACAGIGLVCAQQVGMVAQTHRPPAPTNEVF